MSRAVAGAGLALSVDILMADRIFRISANPVCHLHAAIDFFGRVTGVFDLPPTSSLTTPPYRVEGPSRRSRCLEVANEDADNFLQYGPDS
jgi:hypothetical protein